MTEYKTVLVTGSAGFIGFHLCKLLLDQGYFVYGLDALTDYYDPNLKVSRLNILKTHESFKELNGRLEDLDYLLSKLSDSKIDAIIHLAAQAGVRYSISNPQEYVSTNIVGTFNILEISKQLEVSHLLAASTSSAYGANTEMPFNEAQICDTPMSFYAATKRSNELMAHSYSHIFNIPTTMFRFFTVYGPWGRPDMALYKFAEAIMTDEAIDIYNYGKMKRDFTYVEDLVIAVEKLLNKAPKSTTERSKSKAILGDSISSVAPFRVVNIGNNSPVGLMEYIEALENSLGKKAKKNFCEMQPGDVAATWASTQLLQNLIGFVPNTAVQHGVDKFVDWYNMYRSK